MEECRTIWFNHVTERERERGRQETEKEILWEDRRIGGLLLMRPYKTEMKLGTNKQRRHIAFDVQN
jgi:hypothetical protein